MGGENQTLLLVLFLVLLVWLVFFKKSIGVLSWLVSGHLDLGLGALGGGLTHLSYLNSVKVLGFPAWLMLRFRRGIMRELRVPLPLLLWGMFIVYAALSLLWTPSQFADAGAKQIGYFAAYTMGFAALYAAWRAGDLGVKNVVALVVISGAMAVLQTYFLGNSYGRTLYFARYVSFTSKQQFGEFLFATITLLLFLPGVGKRLRLLVLAALFVELFLNGSRTGAMATLLAVLVFFFTKRGMKGVFFGVALVCMLGIGYVAKNDLLSAAQNLTTNSRLSQLVSSAESGKGIENVGTFKARLDLWGGTLQIMRHWTLTSKIFGKGVSSVGEIAKNTKFSRIAGKVIETDPNRMLHNELLRSAFEFGAIGFLVFVAFLLSIASYVFRSALPRHAKLMLLAFLPGFLMFLFDENIFSGSGSAGGIGFVLVLSYVFSARKEVRHEAEASTSVDSAIAADDHQRRGIGGAVLRRGPARVVRGAVGYQRGRPHPGRRQHSMEGDQ